MALDFSWRRWLGSVLGGRTAMGKKLRRAGRRPSVALVSRLESRVLPTVLTVNSLADDTIGGDGLVTLREAIGAANNDTATDLGETGAGIDEIVFAPDLFGTIFLTGGEMDITSGLMIRGHGAENTVVDAGRLSRIFFVEGAAGDVILDGLSLLNGDAQGGNGGAIESASAASLAIVNSTLSGNIADAGGAIYSELGDVRIAGSTLSGNTAESDGGAVYAYEGDVVVRNSTLSGNQSQEGDGGAILAYFGAVDVARSTLQGNTAERDGGAISAYYGSVTVTECRITGNVAGDDGGALYTYGSSVTVTDSAVSGNTGGNYGGAIYSNDGAITIERSRLEGNTGRFGGAVYAADGEVTILASTLTGNRAEDDGGAIYAGDGVVDISDSTFTGNTSREGEGGAMYAGGGAVTVARSVFTGNVANSGGAIAILGGSLAVVDSRFVGNRAFAHAGGAVDALGVVPVTIDRSLFSGNSAYYDGGAIHALHTLTVTGSTFFSNASEHEGGAIDADGLLIVRDSTFQSNRAVDEGGAIYHSAVAHLINSTISGNSAGDTGGGVGTGTTYGVLNVVNSTIVRNSAYNGGGGVYDDSGNNVLILNSIIAQNTATLGAPDLSVTGTLDLRFSLVGDSTGTGLTPAPAPDGSGNLIGGAGVDLIDPLLGALQNNGGPTFTHALLAGSPALNRGFNGFAIDIPDGNTPLITDQRGAPFARIVGGTVDMGAFEVQGNSQRPLIRNFEAGARTFVEGSAPLLIAGATTTVTDIDSPNFNGGLLTVHISRNADGADRLGIRNVGNGANQVNTVGNQVRVGTIVIGTFTGGNDGRTPLVVTLNNNATAARVALLLKAITFATIGENPSTAPRTIEATLADGQGGISLPVRKTVNVARTNDSSRLVNLDGTPVTFTENGPPVTLDGDAKVEDDDSPNFALGQMIVSIIAGGQAADRLTLGNAITDAGIVTVQDGVVSVDGIEVATFSGGVGTTPLLVRFNDQSTAAAASALLQALTFHNVSDTPSAAQRNIRVQLTDGDGGSVINSLKRVNVTPTNDGATIGGVTTPVNFGVGGPAALLFGEATFTDPDTTNFNNATLTLAPTGGFVAGDLLNVRNQGAGAGQINRIGNTIRIGTLAIGTVDVVNNGVDGNALTITLNANATAARIQALLRNLTFTTTAGAGLRNLNATLTEADATASNIVAQTINVT